MVEAIEKPQDYQEAVASPEFAELQKMLPDREWRLDNLYWIKDSDGHKIKFKRNEAQMAYHKAAWFRDLIPKARKLGFSTYIAILILDECLFRKNIVAGIVDRSIDDACDKLSIIRFAYQSLPPEIRAARQTVKDNEKEIVWDNGSSVTVGTTYRGGTPLLLHVSEYGPVSAESPETAKEIKNGAIQAVPASGRIWVESTSKGSSGEFYDMVKRGQAMRDAKQPLTPIDFKSHFFGWPYKPEYRVQNNLVIVPQDLTEYFNRMEHVIGRKLDADQRAWYTKKYQELGPDDVKQEFPTCEAELFFNSLEGAYFKREMSAGRTQGRIGGMVPFDPSRRVNTGWDIGEDGTCVWFHQTDGLRHRLIDYFGGPDISLQEAVTLVGERAAQRGFRYEKHYGPHDLDNRDWAQQHKTKKAIAADLGLHFTVVDRVPVKGDAIETARRMLNLTWIDQEHCEPGVEALDSYSKKWNKVLGMFMAEPLHNWASHPADAFETLAMGLVPEKPERQVRTRGNDRPRTTAWAS